MAGGLLAQNPTTPDTLIKKIETAKANFRKDTRPLKDRIDFDLNTRKLTTNTSATGAHTP